MTKIETRTLSGKALDWAVAKCEGIDVSLSETGFLIFLDPSIRCGPRGVAWSPSTNSAQGWPIVAEIRGITLKTWPDATCCNSRCEAHIYSSGDGWVAFGPTLLVAALRCYAASKLGDVIDVIDVPDELFVR